MAVQCAQQEYWLCHVVNVECCAIHNAPRSTVFYISVIGSKLKKEIAKGPVTLVCTLKEIEGVISAQIQ